jgi:hypothetical protein
MQGHPKTAPYGPFPAVSGLASYVFQQLFRAPRICTAGGQHAGLNACDCQHLKHQAARAGTSCQRKARPQGAVQSDTASTQGKAQCTCNVGLSPKQRWVSQLPDCLPMRREGRSPSTGWLLASTPSGVCVLIPSAGSPKAWSYGRTE